MRQLHRVFAAAALLGAIGLTSVAHAQSGTDYAQVEALSSVHTVHPGERFVLAFRFRMQPMWHIYWENPGETGAPTTITVKAPKGYKVGQTMYPRPHTIPGPLLSYGYEHEAIFFIPIAAPDELEDDRVTFDADINFLVCKEMCYLGSTTASVAVRTTSEPLPEVPDEEVDPEQLHATGKRFDDPQLGEAYQNLPKRLKRIRRATTVIEGNRVTISGPARGVERMDFFPNHTPGVSAEIIEHTVEDHVFKIVVEFEINEANTLDTPPALRGVIALGAKDSDPSYEITVPLTEGASTDAAEDDTEDDVETDDGDEGDGR